VPLDDLPEAPTDFDFIIGDWTVHHERLKARLVDSTDWEEFDGLSSTVKTLGGYGNLEDNLLNYPAGPARAVAVRSFDTVTGNWSIWWLDGQNPTALDVPVRGTFSNRAGTFFAEDSIDGSPILVRFIWVASDTSPTWEQAFSADAGTTWETNWRMTFSAR
jgi:hypothetical protein